jgi:hypothetical protein
MVKSRVKNRDSIKRKRTKRPRTKRTGKRPLNAYFKAMLSAKKQGLSSFVYKNKTYVGKKHDKLGMIYSSK